MGLLYRRPYWNVWAISMMAFVVWHAVYAWVFDGVRDQTMLFGDDASVAAVTGGLGFAGLLLGMGQRFASGAVVAGRALMPNLLFCVGIATIVALEIVTLAAYAFANGYVDLKGVVIGTVIAGIFTIINVMMGLATGLVEEPEGQ